MVLDGYRRIRIPFLRITQLQQLVQLHTLDLRYNQKCGRSFHLSYLQNELQHISSIEMTLWETFRNISGAYVGKSAADRDPLLLRSQLEPLRTVALMKRLVQDFGQQPTDAKIIDRAGVMERLLKAYADEGYMDRETGVGRRERVFC